MPGATCSASTTATGSLSSAAELALHAPSKSNGIKREKRIGLRRSGRQRHLETVGEHGRLGARRAAEPALGLDHVAGAEGRADGAGVVGDEVEEVDAQLAVAGGERSTRALGGP